MDLYTYILTWVNYFLSLTNLGEHHQVVNNTKPNIIVIMTDDMGWNDVSFHGSNEIPTPNVDALAYSGVILNRHYVSPTCTPSRAAFFTGRHAIRMGLQGLPINVAEPRGIPLREKILPQYLKELGYVTRLVGKWHLGYYTDEHTPTRRGFDSYAGFYNGYVRYFDHTISRRIHTGVDLHMDTPEKLQPHQDSRYITDFITEQAETIIRSHDQREPLYLHIAHAAAHASENAEPIEVRDMAEVNATLGYIPDLNRRKYAGLVTAMDDSVGKVVKALSDTGMLDNSVVIFMSDNGAATSLENYPNYGSNYPLRGMKTGVFEGAVRVPTCIFSPLIAKSSRSRVSDEYVHVTDWLPTIYKLAGGEPDTPEDIDGLDQWPSIGRAEKTKREALLVNIDEVIGPQAAIMGRYKFIRGVSRYYGYYGNSGKDYAPKDYNVTSVETSDAARAIGRSLNGSFPTGEKIAELRTRATLSCKRKTDSKCHEDCLFDIVADPCETKDLSDLLPETVVILRAYIEGYQAVLTPQTNDLSDPAGFPENFGGYWMPWLDAEHTPAKDRNRSAIWSPNNYCEGYAYDDPRNCLRS